MSTEIFGCKNVLNINMWHLQDKFFYEIISGAEIYPQVT